MRAPKTRYAKSGDVSIAYQAFGEGATTLVLAPAWVSHIDLAWDEPAHARYLENLASFARVILFDKRGTGASDRQVGTPCLQDRMDDIRAVMDAAGVERAAIFGCCDGAAMASMFAAVYPQRTTHLILSGNFARRLRADDYPWGQTPDERRRQIEILERNWGEGMDMASLAPSRRGDQAFLDWCGRLERAAASPSSAAAFARLNTEIDVRCVLPIIQTPTLVLHHRDDREVPCGEIAHAASAIPGARLVEFDGADHLHWSHDGESVVAEVQEFVTGVRPTPQIDSALVTILCTDLVDSTVRAADLGDHRWNSLLERHDDIVVAELRRHQGRKINTTGDGVLAAFDSPGRGIRAAMAIKQALAALELSVRAGVHTGECELRQGVPSGIALNIGARVAALAGAGEIYASRTVRDLAVGAGLCFQDRGEHQLKGVPGEWRIYAVMAG